MCYLRRPHVNKSGKPWSLPDPYIILSPHHPARHLGHLHAAAGHGLHHLARVVELLLRAAMSAPSARNRRPWAFIVVDNKALLRQLADSLPYAQSAAAAPMAVVVCGVLTESQGATNAGWWVQDAAAASENLLLAAHAVGLGRLSGRACIPPRIACVPSATCWGFPAASCRAAQRDTDRLSSRKSRSQAEVGPCKGPLQRLGRVNGIPVQTAGILCY